MNDKCGLINADNPCRCEKKATSFMKAGWVDPKNRKFSPDYVNDLKERSQIASPALDNFLDREYAKLFRDHPVYAGPDMAAYLSDLVSDPEARRIFDL